jgi:phosphoglycolate phosphatase-like HAD superfamily hydrolase
MQTHSSMKLNLCILTFFALTLIILSSVTASQSQDPLPSWNDGPNKQAIIEFVTKTTDQNQATFIPPTRRIATFDNDGTLWSEQPLYFQAIYIFDRIRELAPEHPEWQQNEPYASVLNGDSKSALAGGKQALLEMLMGTHAAVTASEFSESVADWLAAARHPDSGQPYTAMVYKPMLELLDYLRDNDFKVFIVSGGGIDFLRVFAEEVYGVPPEQVVGSSLKAKYEIRNGLPVIVKQAELDFIDDKAGKPVGIHRYIGRRPILAVGNSDGDFEMLEWTSAGKGPSLAMIVHHDDAEREWAYDRESHIGRLVRGLDEGPQRGWKIISMKNDWNLIYP